MLFDSEVKGVSQYNSMVTFLCTLEQDEDVRINFLVPDTYFCEHMIMGRLGFFLVSKVGKYFGPALKAKRNC